MIKRKLIKRENQKVVIPKEFKDRLTNNLCPICSKPKSEWTRRKDWRCCSVECTDTWNKDVYIWSWGQLRLRAFRRDKFKCVKCGFESRKEMQMEYYEAYRKYWADNYLIFEDKGKSIIIGDECQLIGDHIKPIALGGDEWELNNVQTLCSSCNKIKTKIDMKEMAIARRIPLQEVTN